MENFQAWMLSIVIIIISGASQFAVNKYQNSEFKAQIGSIFFKLSECEKFINTNSPLLVHLSKVEGEVSSEISKQGEQITTIKEKISQAPSMKEVRAEFVSKEMFIQFEKHIDKQFVLVHDGQNQILQELRRIE